LVAEETGQPFVVVIVEPSVDGVGIAVAEQAGVGHSMRGLSVRNLE
jgi:hypothetical protein